MTTDHAGEIEPSQVAILVPILRRAHRVAPLAANVAAVSPGARLVFVATPGDSEVIDAIEECDELSEYALSPWPENGRGDYARKINMGYRVTDEPYLFLGADDLEFTTGWLEACSRALWKLATEQAPGRLAAGFPIVDTPAVIGTNDGGNPRVLRGEHSTHSLVTRCYVQAFGQATIDHSGEVYSEHYWHEGVDDELVETARERRCWIHAGPHSLIRHLHPDWGAGPSDAQYEADRRARMRNGKALLERRRALWRPALTASTRPR